MREQSEPGVEQRLGALCVKGGALAELGNGLEEDDDDEAEHGARDEDGDEHGDAARHLVLAALLVLAGERLDQRREQVRERESEHERFEDRGEAIHGDVHDGARDDDEARQLDKTTKVALVFAKVWSQQERCRRLD